MLLDEQRAYASAGTGDEIVHQRASGALTAIASSEIAAAGSPRAHGSSFASGAGEDSAQQLDFSAIPRRVLDGMFATALRKWRAWGSVSRSVMRQRCATVLAPVCAIVAGAVVIAALWAPSGRSDAPVTEAAALRPAPASGSSALSGALAASNKPDAMASSASSRSPATSSPQGPQSYERPLGGQFLLSWAARFYQHDGPPLLFLLSSTELNSPRYRGQLSGLAEAMARELAAVLDEGCRQGCSPQVGLARSRLRELLAAEHRRDGPARLRRWQTDDEVPVDHRSIALAIGAAQISLDVACSCASSTIGMQMWNDITTCDASLLDRGLPVLRYAPRIVLVSGKHAVFRPLDAYYQTVSFPDGETLVIESGYSYSGDDVNQPRQRAEVRGKLRWSRRR